MFRIDDNQYFELSVGNYADENLFIQNISEALREVW